jgi:hypothetical protein
MRWSVTQKGLPLGSSEEYWAIGERWIMDLIALDNLVLSVTGNAIVCKYQIVKPK